MTCKDKIIFCFSYFNYYNPSPGWCLPPCLLRPACFFLWGILLRAGGASCTYSLILRCIADVLYHVEFVSGALACTCGSWCAYAFPLRCDLIVVVVVVVFDNAVSCRITPALVRPLAEVSCYLGIVLFLQCSFALQVILLLLLASFIVQILLQVSIK